MYITVPELVGSSKEFVEQHLYRCRSLVVKTGNKMYSEELPDILFNHARAPMLEYLKFGMTLYGKGRPTHSAISGRTPPRLDFVSLQVKTVQILAVALRDIAASLHTLALSFVDSGIRQLETHSFSILELSSLCHLTVSYSVRDLFSVIATSLCAGCISQSICSPRIRLAWHTLSAE